MTLDEFIEDFKKCLDEPLHDFEAMYKVENLTDPEANPMSMLHEEWTARFMPYLLRMAANRFMEGQ